MNFNLITIMPELVVATLQHGVVGRSFASGINTAKFLNPRDYTSDGHKTVDDRPFGGGDGMLMLAEPLAKCLESLPLATRGRVLMMSPQGRRLDDPLVSELGREKNLTLISARYGGVDQRFINAFQLEEVTIGDYVLSGGELACAVLIDAVVRKIPGVLGHLDSAAVDTFGRHGLLEAPSFTRPRQWREQEVPAVLLSGHHALLEDYQHHVGMMVTLKKRPDLVSNQPWPWRETLKYLDSLTDADLVVLGLARNELTQLIKSRL